jgi:hypothetical protein
MDENRKVWEKPELIVLVRSKPGEMVLTGCKMGDGSSPPGAGPNDNVGWCAGVGCAADCSYNWDPS